MITLNTSEAPVASILVPSQDNPEMLTDCLSSIARTIDGVATPYEVIVLFQQMSVQSVQAFLSRVRGVHKLHSRLNLGFGGGNNFAARHAKGKYLVFLNDDTIAREGWLQSLLAAIEGDQSVGAVGSRILFPDGRLQESGAIVWSDGSCYPLGRGSAPGSLAYSYVRDVDYASANGLLVRRDTFERAGGFDARFFPGYYEDVDLCLTIRHVLGQRVVYEPRSVILHRESATSNRDPGFKTFLFQRHRALLNEKWATVLASYPTAQPESPAAVERAVLRARGNPKTVLVVDDRVPSVGMGSGAGRTADLLEELVSDGYAVTMCATDRGRMPLTNVLGGLGVDLIAEPLAEHLARAQKRYDAVIISRPHNYQAFADSVRRTMPNAALVYDVEALYHRRLFIQAALESDPSQRERLQAEAEWMQDLEIEIARTADRLVAISDSEVEWLASVDGHAPIDFMRPLANGLAMTPPHLESRSGAVFIAGWLAGEGSPNVNALRWYVEQIVPRVRSVLPDFVTHVSGSNPPLSVQAMESSAVVLTGLVQSIEDLYRSARIAISPILAGAGVKIKTIESLQFGVPVVATTIGAEGLGLVDGEELDIADDPDEFAKRLIALASDDGLWMRRRQKITEKLAQWQSDQLRWSEVVARVLHERQSAGAIAR